jgi:hypothetical protein
MLACGCAAKAKKAKTRPPRILYEGIGGMVVYREDEKGRNVYRVKCEGCGATGEKARG